MTVVSYGLPDFFQVQQKFVPHPVASIENAVRETLIRSGVAEKIRPSQQVAIAVGSRGIANLATIVRATIDYVKSLDAVPVIVPAMGSHGGATPDGQRALLASFGVDEHAMGCRVEPDMNTVHAGDTDDGLEVRFSEFCTRVDHVIIVNRVKPHTRLTGLYESGLIKMLMIGLGKHHGAQIYHQTFQRYDYCLDRIAPTVVEMLLKQMPITLGLAIIEDAHDNTSHIEAVAPEDFLAREPELLDIARARMPRLPFDRADLVIVDRIGKEFSGTGMDTNVLGRKSNDNAAMPDEFPKVRLIFVRSLSPKSGGNASGIGIAEFCRTQVVRDMDSEITRINCLTSGHVTAAAIPMHFETDREVLLAAMTQNSRPDPTLVHWIWIRDTLHLGHVACSRGLWDAVAGRDDLRALTEPEPLIFDAEGNLKSPFSLV